MVFVATQGYRALTREDVAATVTTEPLGPHQFRATFVMADGTRARDDLRGDALYVNAHVVKWHPWANVLGLHTAYRLDRVAGRYENIDDERTKARTVYRLANDQPIDIFRLARRYTFLAPMVQGPTPCPDHTGLRCDLRPIDERGRKPQHRAACQRTCHAERPPFLVGDGGPVSSSAFARRMAA